MIHKNNENFCPYIRLIASDLDCSIANDALHNIEFIIHICLKRIIEFSINLLNCSNEYTLSIKTLSSVIRILYPNELSKPILDYATNILNTFNRSQSGKGKRKTKESRAGLKLKVSRVNNILRENINSNIYRDVSVFLTAILEFIVGSIIERVKTERKDIKRINSKGVSSNYSDLVPGLNNILL